MKKTLFLRRFPLLMGLIFYSTVMWGQYIVNFEGPGETKTAYASGTVNLSGLNWNMTDALIGTDASDWKNGLRSARLRGYGTTSISMLENKPNGIGTISFQYRRYGSDPQVEYKVEYSIDNGVNWVQIGVPFTAPASNDVQTFSETVNIDGGVRIRIKTTAAGTVNKRLNIDDITVTDYSTGPGAVATPTFDPTQGNFFNPFQLTILCSTPDAEIHYTTDGVDPDINSPIFDDPIPITQTTTVKAIAFAEGLDPSSIATSVYTFPVIVSTLAELRAGVPGMLYQLTGEVILTYQQEWRNQKFVQDMTAGILIDDLTGVIASDYEIGDGVTGLVGTIANYNTMLQFTPAADPGDPTSAGNVITPVSVTIAELNNNFENYESELIIINNTTFTNGGATFVGGQVYPITDVSDASFNFRATFYDADYIGTTIPISACNLTGIPNAYSGSNYFTSRFSSDIVPIVTTPTILITSPNGNEYWEQGSTHNITWANISFTGNVKISLIRGFNTTVLVPDVPNTGSWSWDIPLTQALGTNYKIKVQGINTGDPSDTSDDFFSIIAPLPDPVIVINEIMYNPSNANPFMNDDYYEYLELFNNSGFDVYLDNCSFSAGIDFTFPVGTAIPDGGYLVVAKNADTIASYYGITNVIQWTSGNLGNSGEPVTLVDPEGGVLDDVSYLDVAPWPTTPDGFGPSLELLDPALDNSLAENWAASAAQFGTPGVQNSVAGLEILTLTAPNGGEVFEQGSSQTITWTHTNFSGSIKIELITALKSREILAENIPVTDLMWDWEIPADYQVGTNYKIKISDMIDGSPMDESDATFSIVAVITPSITVTSPNGGESWEQGSAHNINWTAESFTGNVKIELADGTTTVVLADAIAATTGTWLWNIPADQATGANYTVIVSGTSTGDPTDQSDAPFAIIAPVGIPNIVINEIMYNSIEATDNEWIELLNMESVTIDLSGYMIKDNSNTHVVTFPAGYSIAPGQFFTVAIKIGTAPLFFTPDWNANASWGLDNSTDQVRLYTASGAIVDSLQYGDTSPWPTSPDGSGPSLELIDPTFDNTLPESWLGSLATNGTPGAQNSVYQYEAVTVTFPNGGEIFEQGSSQSLTWTYAGFSGSLKIELITAADSREILAENVPVTDGVWDWEVPQDQPVGANFKIKISDMIDGSPMDESDGVFSIASVIIPSLTVISPNGGEEWVQGTTHNIEWSTSYFTGLVKIQLFDGMMVTTLVESLAADASPYSWTIPADQPEGTEYAVIVSGMETGDPVDMSDAPFSIVAPAPLPNLVINEIMYNSPGNDNEWVEIYNNDTYTVDLEGFYLIDADDLHVPVVFPAGYSIAPGQYFTVSLEILTPPLHFTPDYTGNAAWSLGNTSDDLRLFNPTAQLVDHVNYFDTAPWPTSPDGSGPSLSLLDPSLDNNLGESWDGSPITLGTPGSVNFPETPTLIVISPNGGESIQQGTTFNISWYSQQFAGDIKIELLDVQNTTSEVLFASLPHDQGNVDWTVTQAAGTNYKIKISDVIDGDPMDESDEVFSIVEPAGLPKIVINEIMYNPPETGTDSLEFIELYNNDVMAVDLAGWAFTQGVDFTFPTYSLAPGDYLVVAYNAGAVLRNFGVTALQWTAGGLSNGGEALQLKNNTGEVIDELTFDDATPWPVAPDEYGPSLALLDPSTDNSAASNWAPETKLAMAIPGVYNVFASPGALNFPEPAQSYLIASGWSGISSYVASDEPYVSTLMNLVENDLVVMQDFSKLYFPLYGINTIDEWMINTGYALKMNKARYHVIWGEKASGNSIMLSAGWNGISVLSECAVNASELFSGLTDIIFVKEMGTEKVYWPDGGIFTLDYLMPGYAYYVKAGAETTISFPACSSKQNYIEQPEKKENLTSWNDIVNTNVSHTIGFTASALSMLAKGDVVGAFATNGRCAGMVTVEDGPVAMMLWGDDVYTSDKEGLNENEIIRFRVFRPSSGIQFEVFAAFDPAYTSGNTFSSNGISLVTELKESYIGINEPTREVASLYPNPATDNLTIVSASVFNRAEIYTATGQLVYSSELAQNERRIDVQHLQKGFYFVKLYDSSNGLQTTLSFVKD